MDHHHTDSSLSVPFKALLVLFCSCMSTSVSLLIREAEHNDKLLFSPMAASFLAELIKLCIGFGLMISTLRKSLNQIRGISRSDLRLFFVPAFFFATSNNLRFIVMKAVNPGLVSVIWNLKIVVVGLMYQIPPFSRPLSLRQWVGAGLLVVGATVAKLSEDGSTDSDGVSNSGGRFGLVLLMIQLILAASAGVCAEYAYKSTADRIEFPAQCSILYAFGATLNLIAFVIAGLNSKSSTSMQDNENEAKVAESFPGSLFSGFDLWSWLAIFSIACSGFVVGMIFKYLDSVAQVFTDMIGMFLTAFLSWMLFGLEINAGFLGALVVCATSIALYYELIGEKCFIGAKHEQKPPSSSYAMVSTIDDSDVWQVHSPRPSEDEVELTTFEAICSE